jgi:predicted GNAT family acetyltransferase
MTGLPSSDAVHDDQANSRLVLEVDGSTAELIYDTEPGRLVLIHTEVPEVLGGRGIGGQLVRAAVKHARDEGLTVVPWCPFARRWLAEHPDVSANVPIDWKTLPPAPYHRHGAGSD